MSALELKADKKINEKKDLFLTKDDKVDILEKIAQSESRLTMRMFLFWIGTIGVLSGIMFALLQAYVK